MKPLEQPSPHSRRVQSEHFAHVDETHEIRLVRSTGPCSTVTNCNGGNGGNGGNGLSIGGRTALGGTGGPGGPCITGGCTPGTNGQNGIARLIK